MLLISYQAMVTLAAGMGIAYLIIVFMTMKHPSKLFRVSAAPVFGAPAILTLLTIRTAMNVQQVPTWDIWILSFLAMLVLGSYLYITVRS